MNSCEIVDYSIENLKKLLAEKAGTSLRIINDKQHCVFLEGYFKELEAKTIVVESHYIDRDYLEDFAGYYVKCFKDYVRKCTRLHFFKSKISKRAFNNLLRVSSNFSKNKNKLQESYLGFIVIKPLPRTIIGRTCLKTYPSENRRFFPATRRCEANLFGLDLKIQSLPFQEQDSVAAACATSALWSVLNGTGKLFHHPIISPVEITKRATRFSEHKTRSLPNKEGLTGTQMAYAIRSVSLDPYLVNCKNEHILKSTIYAYLRGKIPLLMGIIICKPNPTANDDLKIEIGNPIETFEYYGKHAVAITGFSLGFTKPKPFRNFLLKATRINKIYAHDDQAGPFARMEFDEKKSELNGKEYVALKTSWFDGNGRALTDLLIAPLYNKIRIPFEVVHDAVAAFDQFIEALKSLGAVTSFIDRLEWDIYLIEVNELKKDLIATGQCNGISIKDVLLENMPKYIWRATALNGDKAVLDLLFDATDIEQGAFFVRAIEYDQDLGKILRSVSKTNIVDNLPIQPTMRTLLESIFYWFSLQPV